MRALKNKKIQKKEIILRAALELFKRYGFKKVSITDIAHEAGVSHVTIFNNFGSKERLIRDAIKTQIMGMLEKYRTIIQGTGSFPEKLKAIVFDKAETSDQFQRQLAGSFYQRNLEMKEFIKNLWQNDINQLTLDLIALGRKEGYIADTLPKEPIMLYLKIFRDGLLANLELLGNSGIDSKIFIELNSILLYGLMGKRGKGT